MFACDTNRIFDEVAMWVLRHVVNETFENALNNRMFASYNSFLFAASVRSIDNRSRKLWQLYLGEVNYLLPNYSVEQAIAKFNDAILRYTSVANAAPQHYADDLVAKSCNIADIDMMEVHSPMSLPMESNRHFAIVSLDLLYIAF